MQFLLPGKALEGVRKARLKAGLRAASAHGNNSASAISAAHSPQSGGGNPTMLAPLATISSVLLRSAKEMELQKVAELQQRDSGGVQGDPVRPPRVSPSFSAHS